MQAMNLLDNLEYRADAPSRQAVHVSPNGRIVRFALKAGQSIPPHRAANASLCILVVKGRGLFAGEDGVKREFGPGAFLVFEPGESHSIDALDEELVFIAILHGIAASPAAVEGLTLRET